MRKTGKASVAVGMALAICLAGCGENDSGDPVIDQSEVSSVISQVESVDAGVLASLRSGAVPSPNGGPTIATADTATVVNGGSSLVLLQTSVPTQRILVWVRTAGAAADLDGYFEVVLPGTRTQITLQVTIAQTADTVATSFDCIYAAVDESGRVGPSTPTTVRIVPVGTGDLQISVAWDAFSDVDLHVIEPSGEEIFYDNRSSATQGQLDLDSNAACEIDGVNNENVTWPQGSAPRGLYTVRVDYYLGCGVPSSNYVVTIQRGGAPETFRGTFTGGGDGGHLGSGTTVAQFTY